MLLSSESHCQDEKDLMIQGFKYYYKSFSAKLGLIGKVLNASECKHNEVKQNIKVLCFVNKLLEVASLLF